MPILAPDRACGSFGNRVCKRWRAPIGYPGQLVMDSCRKSARARASGYCLVPARMANQLTGRSPSSMPTDRYRMPTRLMGHHPTWICETPEPSAMPAATSLSGLNGRHDQHHAASLKEIRPRPGHADTGLDRAGTRDSPRRRRPGTCCGYRAAHRCRSRSSRWPRTQHALLRMTRVTVARNSAHHGTRDRGALSRAPRASCHVLPYHRHGVNLVFRARPGNFARPHGPWQHPRPGHRPGQIRSANAAPTIVSSAARPGPVLPTTMRPIPVAIS
jgi:hypothetical protein